MFGSTGAKMVKLCKDKASKSTPFGWQPRSTAITGRRITYDISRFGLEAGREFQIPQSRRPSGL